jgi:hypothetical protein
VKLLDAHELPIGERIRLEAIKLVLQLKGQLQPAGQAVHATQIVIHTSGDSAVRAAPEEPKIIEIDI